MGAGIFFKQVAERWDTCCCCCWELLKRSCSVEKKLVTTLPPLAHVCINDIIMNNVQNTTMTPQHVMLEWDVLCKHRSQIMHCSE